MSLLDFYYCTETLMLTSLLCPALSIFINEYEVVLVSCQQLCIFFWHSRLTICSSVYSAAFCWTWLHELRINLLSIADLYNKSYRWWCERGWAWWQECQWGYQGRAWPGRITCCWASKRCQKEKTPRTAVVFLLVYIELAILGTLW